MQRGPKTHYREDGSPKRTFQSRREARTVARRVGQQAYRCRDCGKVHTGRKLGRRKRYGQMPPACERESAALAQPAANGLH
jgi:plasmid stabilization system protein ParE